MNFTIEVTENTFRSMKGTSTKTNKPYDMAMQDGYLHKGGKYPDKFEVPLQEKDAQGNWIPYAVGWYTVTPDSVEVRDGRLSFNNYEMRLLRIADEKPAAVKAA